MWEEKPLRRSSLFVHKVIAHNRDQEPERTSRYYVGGNHLLDAHYDLFIYRKGFPSRVQKKVD